MSAVAEAWRAARPVLGVPAAAPDALFILAAAVWFILVVAYAAQGPVQLLADLRDPVLAPFVSVPPIVAMALSAALAGVAFAAGRVLVVIFLTITLALGGWLMGQWVLLDIAHDRLHPDYFLPTVAGGFIGAIAATDVNLHGAAERCCPHWPSKSPRRPGWAWPTSRSVTAPSTPSPTGSLDTPS